MHFWKSVGIIMDCQYRNHVNQASNTCPWR